MAKFIVLTNALDGTPIYINPDKIDYVNQPKRDEHDEREPYVEVCVSGRTFIVEECTHDVFNPYSFDWL